MSTSFVVKRLDHVQVAIPEGGEPRAEAFYSGILGLAVLPKPEPLAGRGGRWFGRDGVQIHVGVEKDFRPAKKAHPALVFGGLNALVARLAESGIGVRWDDEIPTTRRCFIEDPFGNRIELIEG